ncbi:hypothetical protein ACFFLZ_12910 [Photobacterium aphoticum]|uniref:Uncharacterized protein n=1 Tax=Photobacterium aphoticum TaxID=754436 RepID=A0A0J1GML5_9GAMM|nr:hypothetical protein [Photobacterium aphoticum]KLV00846.1 hypothetical protein ABT58_10525 [Photobacterium aphoticum]PSU55821.1 hypothetical protein C9I90_14860 [Photobacterium aphoticum]GHA52523.1 hypothetical protein GCM10007086_28240 [Photobacterium aphoticum]
MKKKIKLSYEVSLALFKDDVDLESSDSFFKIMGDDVVKLTLPTSIMHRLFRLGQAYGIKHLRFLESECKLIVGVAELSQFVGDLKKVLKLINDEVLHVYINRILDEISKPSNKRRHIAISTGNYY